MNMSSEFELQYAHAEGCAECQCILFEGDLVRYVNGEVTCIRCVEDTFNKTAIGRKAKALRDRRL